MSDRVNVAVEFDAFVALMNGGKLFEGLAFLRDDFPTLCADTFRNCGLPVANIAAEISRTSTAEDVAWFETHRGRSYRLRYALKDELVLSMAGALPAPCVIVEQTSPGTRLVVAVPDGLTDPRVEPRPLFDDADRTYPDRDILLALLFASICQWPGAMVDTNKIIEIAWTLTPSAGSHAGAALQ